MEILTSTKLRIRDQHELLNQIAGTYKDFFRAAMEYVDNAVDAAEILKHSGNNLKPKLEVFIDSKTRKVAFQDNCGGMSPEELCDLLSEVGRSKKKTVAWANGQFGFGVHAFRAFAKEANFISHKKGFPESSIKIDRSFDENKKVNCIANRQKFLAQPGTRVEIARFDRHAFKKGIFVQSLVSEIEHHFDDVLRSKLIKIYVFEDANQPYECHYFEYDHLNGTVFKKEKIISYEGKTYPIVFDLKILDKAQSDRLPVLINKKRRIQTVYDLKSYKNFVRNQGRSMNVWEIPFVVGTVEIDNFCSPNLTRDDLKASETRDLLYSEIFEAQQGLEKIVDEVINAKTQDSFKKISDVMSSCLSEVLRKFKLQYERFIPSYSQGNDEGQLNEEGELEIGEGVNSTWFSDLPDLPGGNSSGNGTREKGEIGSGKDGKKSQNGMSEGVLTTDSGPSIKFQNHADADRVIDLESSLIVNTLHPDFLARNQSRAGRIKLDSRLINYLCLIISPFCVHRLFEKKGKVPTPLDVGQNIIDLSTTLEKALNDNLLGQEVETL